MSPAEEARSAVVTGASSGIGEATARRLDRDGFRLLLVARRKDRLERLAGSLADAAVLAVDLTDDDAPARVASRVEDEWGRLDLLVNNAGTASRAAFGDEQGGYGNVRRTMALNFDAVVRLTEALLPILRRSAPSAIVNISSIAGRVGLPRSGAYNASKFALTGWTEALRFEEARHGVHVGLVLPGFIATEGFPQDALLSRATTRWMVSTPEKVADTIVRVGRRRKAERSVPRPYGLVPALRAVAPRVWRRVAAGMRR
jgi:short-subunit dehydrogenase